MSLYSDEIENWSILQAKKCLTYTTVLECGILSLSKKEYHDLNGFKEYFTFKNKKDMARRPKLKSWNHGDKKSQELYVLFGLLAN